MTISIGELLKQARLARKLSVEQVAQSTRIRPHHITAMETDDYTAIPSTAQARGFLRIYAEFLSLDINALLAEQNAEKEQTPAENATSKVIPADLPSPFAVSEEVETEEELADTQEAEETSPEIVAAPAQSFVTFADIGSQLRQRRELLSLTLNEIERHIHIRMHYLLALEAGKMDDLPSPVQARGMLSSYASFLDLNSEAVLNQFADGLQAQRLERLPSLPDQQKKSAPKKTLVPNFLKRYISTDLLVGGGLLLFIIIFSIWGVNQVLGAARGTTDSVPTAPSISDALLSPIPEDASGQPTSAVLQQPATETPQPQNLDITTTPLPTLPSRAKVQVIISVKAGTFLRVSVDGAQVFNGRVEAGSAYPFDGKQQIEILVGDGASIEIIHNQKNLGAIGAPGQVVNLIYTAESILNPSPTVSPTPSATPRPSTTPKVTPTSSIPGG